MSEGFFPHSRPERVYVCLTLSILLALCIVLSLHLFRSAGHGYVRIQRNARLPPPPLDDMFISSVICSNTIKNCSFPGFKLHCCALDLIVLFRISTSVHVI